MPTLGFILLSAIYTALLAITDGLFNRLVFREIKDEPYESAKKQAIYKSWEWRYIGLIFLIVLPIIIPGIAAYFLGGVKFVLIYLAVFSLIQWDVIFGKLVFNNWLGDSPSIALPYFGWFKFDIKGIIVFRTLLFLVLILIINKV